MELVIGIAILLGIPITAAATLRTSTRNRILIAIAGAIGTILWCGLILWLATT